MSQDRKQSSIEEDLFSQLSDIDTPDVLLLDDREVEGRLRIGVFAVESSDVVTVSVVDLQSESQDSFFAPKDRVLEVISHPFAFAPGDIALRYFDEGTDNREAA